MWDSRCSNIKVQQHQHQHHLLQVYTTTPWAETAATVARASAMALQRHPQRGEAVVLEAPGDPDADGEDGEEQHDEDVEDGLAEVAGQVGQVLQMEKVLCRCHPSCCHPSCCHHCCCHPSCCHPLLLPPLLLPTYLLPPVAAATIAAAALPAATRCCCHHCCCQPSCCQCTPERFLNRVDSEASYCTRLCTCHCPPSPRTLLL